MILAASFHAAPVTAQGLSTPVLEAPGALAVDTIGNLYIADWGLNMVLALSPTGTLRPLAGTGFPGSNGDSGDAATMQLNSPAGVAVNSAGDVFISDTANNRVVRVSAGKFSTVLRDSPQTPLALPAGLAFDASGNLLIAVSGSELIARLSTSGQYDVFVPKIRGPSQIVNAPKALAMDSHGNLFIAQKSELDELRAGFAIPTRADTSDPGILPGGVAVDASDAVYATDRCAVVRVNNSGQKTNVAGQQYRCGYADGPPEAALLNSPAGLTVDRTGNLFVADPHNHSVRKIDVTGNVTTAVSGVGRRITAVVGSGLSVSYVGGRGQATLNPGGLMTIFGENFRPAGTGRGLTTAEIADGHLPTTMDGVCVEVNQQRAFLMAMYPNQINFQVPTLAPTPPGQSLPVQVVLDCGSAAEARTNVFMLARDTTAAEFFSIPSSYYFNSIAAVQAQTGQLVGPPLPPPEYQFSTARPGDIVSLYLTGLGPTSPPADPGVIPSSAAQTQQPVRVAITDGAATGYSIGGILLPIPVTVLYAGIAPGYPGLYQVNVQIPSGGLFPIGGADFFQMTLTVGARSSPPGYLYIDPENGAPCIPFPAGLVPFTHVYSTSGPSYRGDRVVLGTMSNEVWAQVRGINSQAPHQRFCGKVELAPGLLVNAYVQTQAEVNGDFSAFGPSLIDPITGQPFPNNQIPAVRMPGVYGWRTGPDE